MAAVMAQGLGTRVTADSDWVRREPAPVAESEWTASALETLVMAYVEEKNIKVGAVIHGLRVAVTGKGIGFGMWEILAILGRERCLARIERALEMVENAAVLACFK